MALVHSAANPLKAPQREALGCEGRKNLRTAFPVLLNYPEGDEDELIIKIKADCVSGQMASVDDVVDPDTGQVNLIFLLSDICDYIQHECGGKFLVTFFDDEFWLVDFRTDFCVVIEQIPAFVKWLKAGGHGLFQLAFFEQGVERALCFDRGLDLEWVCDDDLVVSGLDMAAFYRDRSDGWPPAGAMEIIPVDDLICDLDVLVNDFLGMVSNVCPRAFSVDVFRRHFSDFL